MHLQTLSQYWVADSDHSSQALLEGPSDAVVPGHGSGFPVLKRSLVALLVFTHHFYISLSFLYFVLFSIKRFIYLVELPCCVAQKMFKSSKKFAQLCTKGSASQPAGSEMS